MHVEGGLSYYTTYIFLKQKDLGSTCGAICSGRLTRESRGIRDRRAASSLGLYPYSLLIDVPTYNSSTAKSSQPMIPQERFVEPLET